ncbi:hypothetical protein WA158_008516 [Blastocystis sp. Blastoise]
MVKTYLRYSLDESFGVITSPNAEAQFDHSGRLIVSGALESLIVWNPKLGTKEKVMTDGKYEITKILRSPRKNVFAVGYTDGTIKLWDISKGELLLSLKGHKKAISALSFNNDGSLLVSGSNDTDIVVWDINGETGLYRLRGHKDIITDLILLENKNMIISSSKDTLIKIWDMVSQHCISTYIGHRNEIWSIDILPAVKNETEKNILNEEHNSESANHFAEYLITGCSDQKIRIFDMKKQDTKNIDKDTTASTSDIDNPEYSLDLKGMLTNNQGNSRTNKLRYTENGQYFGWQGVGKDFVLYHVRDSEAANKKMKRRVKRKREKMNKKEGENRISIEKEKEEMQVADIYDSICILKTSQKIKSFDFGLTTKDTLQVLFTHVNNSISVYTIHTNYNDNIENACSYERLYYINTQGHRNDIRSLALNETDNILLSTCGKHVKLWNVRTKICINTIDIEDVISSYIFKGDKYAAVGTKKGDLYLLDISTGDIVQEVKEAHKGCLWSIDIRGDFKGMVTGGADGNVKFWEFELVNSSRGNSKVMNVTPTRTLKMPTDVMCVKYSNIDNRGDANKLLVCVALLDSTVKIFYEDSLRFFLSLYGHKLPVLSMSISTDNKLIVTGSADKNVKIWGLDFGDCHKSLFSHVDSVMNVQFIPNTHMYVTCSKDNTIKYWDADAFINICTIGNHFGEVWCLCISHLGDFIVTGGHDRALHIYKRTNEQIFIEEEKEKEQEEQIDKEIDEKYTNPNIIYDEKIGEEAPENENIQGKTVELNADQTVEGGDSARAANLGSLAVKTAENLINCIETAEVERKKRDEWEEECAYLKRTLSEADYAAKTENGAKSPIPPPEKNILLMNLSPEDYILKCILNMPRANLESSLLVLSFENVHSLFHYCEYMIEHTVYIELAVKIIMSGLQIYEKQFRSSNKYYEDIFRVNNTVKKGLTMLKDRIGTNMEGISYLKRAISNQNIDFIPDEPNSKRTKF